MGDGNSTLLTIVVVAIVALVVLWLLFNAGSSKDHHHMHHGHHEQPMPQPVPQPAPQPTPQPCWQAKPDPVGNVRSECAGPGAVKICWDATPNASKYRVYINECAPVAGKPNLTKKVFTGKHPVGSCNSNCCPENCDACVSQTKYKDLVETDQTCIVYETCKPSICFMVVAYNACGESGDCREINYAQVECRVDTVDAWIVQDDCRGLHIKWNCPKCCDKIHVFVDCQPVACVPCCEGEVHLPAAPECVSIEIACETCCGVGEKVLLRPECQEECESSSSSDSECECEEHHCSHSSRKAKVPGFKSRPRTKPGPRMPAPNRRSEKPRLTVPSAPKMKKTQVPQQGKRRSK